MARTLSDFTSLSKTLKHNHPTTKSYLAANEF